MAKTDEIKFIDQHLEKVILGIGVLIMAYGIFQWVISNPQRSEVPRVNGRVVPTTEVDSKLLGWARDVEERKPKGPEIVTVHRYDLEIAKQRTPAVAAMIGNWGNHRLVMVPPERVKPPEGVRLDKVRGILLTFAPVFTEIKGARELISEEGGVDKLVFRGKAEFPRGALMKAWNKEFRGSAMDTVMDTVLAVEIEKRAVLDDGGFGPITKVSQTPIPGEGGKTRTEEVVLPEYTGKNANEVRKAIGVFSTNTQNNILRPSYWRVWSQGTQSWTTPWIKEEVPDKRPVGGAKVGEEPVERVDDGITKLWFHDTDVRIQTKYSYRMRVVFVNPLYTYDDVAHRDMPKDALEESIPSGWSQWVQAEAIPRTTQYFLTGAKGIGETRQLYCTIFTRSLGQVVAEKAPVSPGSVIGGVVPRQIKNPAGQIVPKVVDFSTSAIAVHVEFDKKFVTRAGRSDETRELICLEGSKLVSHILVKHLPPEDARNTDYEALQAIVSGQPPR